MPEKDHQNCSICQHIPDDLQVETLHTDERLPEQVNQLTVIGGSAIYSGPPEVRKCPECGSYYTYLREHDSESGVGPGWTDEGITRISPGKAYDYLKEALPYTQKMRQYYLDQSKKRESEHYRIGVQRSTNQIGLIKREISKLNKELF